VLKVLTRAQSRAVEDAAEVIDLDKAERIPGSDLDRLVELCARLAGDMRELHKQLYDDLFAGGVRDTQHEGEWLREALAGMLRSVVAVRQRFAGLQIHGRDVSRSLVSLDGVVAELERLAAEHEKNWPWFDEEVHRQSLEDIKAGRLIPLEDYVRELQTV